MSNKFEKILKLRGSKPLLYTKNHFSKLILKIFAQNQKQIAPQYLFVIYSPVKETKQFFREQSS